LDGDLPRSWLPHADAQEYLTFLRTRADVARPELGTMKHYRSFRRHYPDLRAWMVAPLTERVGTHRGVPWPANCSACARPYLYYLVYRGTLRLDWPWILAIRQHVLPPDQLPPEVVGFLAEVGHEAVRLGFAAKAGEQRLPPMLKR